MFNRADCVSWVWMSGKDLTDGDNGQAIRVGIDQLVMLEPFTVCAPTRDLVRELGGSVVRIREEVNMAGSGG